MAVSLLILLPGCRQAPVTGPQIILKISEHDSLFDDKSVPVTAFLILFHEEKAADTLILEAGAPDRYVIDLSQVTGSFADPVDTLRFSFALSKFPAKSMKVESLVRTVTPNHLIDAQPEFVYGEPYYWQGHYLTHFSVDMSNQNVLGFFDPDRGDRIVVSGSFCRWCPEGVELTADGDFVYSGEVLVRQKPGSRLEYNFRIMSDRDVLFSNRGWERRRTRFAELEAYGNLTDTLRLDVGRHFFADQSRVARFIIKLENNRDNLADGNKGAFRIRLSFSGQTYDTDPLMKISENTWETVVMIPLHIDRFDALVYTENDQIVSIIKDIKAKDRGKIIYKSI